MKEGKQYPSVGEMTRLIKEENRIINLIFNGKIFDLQVETNMSQRQLAKSMGIRDAGLISKKYTGKRSWTILSMLHVGICMGVNVLEIIAPHMNPHRKRLMLAKAVMVVDYFTKHEPDMMNQVPRLQWVSDLEKDDWPERE